MNIYLYAGVLGLVAFCAVLQSLFNRYPDRMAKLTGWGLWIGFGVCLSAWVFGNLPGPLAAWGWRVDPLTSLMVLLILFISGAVHIFSLRYMGGDRCFRPYFLNLALLTGSSLVFVGSDSVFLAVLFWLSNQILLSKLMTHKSEWNAAKQAGRLFLQSGLAGSVFLAAGFAILSYEAGSLSIHDLCANAGKIEAGPKVVAFVLIVLAAAVQSGLWPFHRWLLSSLNSPTPVSAFMHAGLVNGGGLLLARLAPFVLSDPLFLYALVGIGIFSLTLGTIWKLIQSNVKKTLACSTMAQMGFMFLQCGLGLFPAAIAHICWHGLFKGFLFLNSGTAVETQTISKKNPGMIPSLYSILGGLLGAAAFSLSAKLNPLLLDTQMVLVFFAAIAAFHISLSAFRFRSRTGFLYAPAASLLFGTVYGSSIRFVEFLLEPMGFWSPQPLGILHIFGMMIVSLFAVGFYALPENWEGKPLWKKIYVKMLNASQSDRKTITAIRSEYNY